ncbi:MAG: alpha-ketoglutarate-dependent dioxygenase AlkB [Congregibacter sp.]
MFDSQSIPLSDAELIFDPAFYDVQTAERLFVSLKQQTPWRSESITLFGKTMLQPRLIAWYGDADVDYGYSGKRLSPEPWTPLLLEIRSAMEEAARQSFNSVLLNLYRDERDSMGLHADDEPELGPAPVIASLSLGADRVFRMKHKTRKDLKPLKLELSNGSLLIMKGPTQQHWKHEVPKSRHACGPRINLTFRKVYDSGK